MKTRKRASIEKKIRWVFILIISGVLAITIPKHIKCYQQNKKVVKLNAMLRLLSPKFHEISFRLSTSLYIVVLGKLRTEKEKAQLLQEVNKLLGQGEADDIVSQVTQMETEEDDAILGLKTISKAQTVYMSIYGRYGTIQDLLNYKITKDQISPLYDQSYRFTIVIEGKSYTAIAKHKSYSEARTFQIGSDGIIK